MKKKRPLLSTKIVSNLFLIATVLSVIIAYTDLQSDIAYYFLLFYLFFAFFMLVYLPVVTFMNLRSLYWADVRKVIIKFMTLFVTHSAVVYVFNYIIRPESINLVSILSVSFGVTFGLAFFDKDLINKKRKNA